MTDGIHTAEHPEQTASGDVARDRRPREAERREVASRDYSVLPRRELRERDVIGAPALAVRLRGPRGGFVPDVVRKPRSVTHPAQDGRAGRTRLRIYVAFV